MSAAVLLLLILQQQRHLAAITDNIGFGGHNAALVFKAYAPSK